MTGLLTFYWADDYGAMLQAYALKRCLEALGEQVEVIPYAPYALTGRYWWSPLLAARQPGGVKYWINRPGWRRNLAMGTTFWERKRAMGAFRRRYLTARLPIRRADRVSLAGYDHVFVGSDQIWNPDITVVLDDAYIGNVGERGTCRLTAYGASLGRSWLPEEDQARFARFVGENFQDVSLREQSAVPFVEGLLHRPAVDVVDPVLLLRRSDWERISLPPQERGYILLHGTELNQDMFRFADRLARQLHTIVIQTSLPAWKETREWVQLRVKGGPAEFLGYIRNAACVITNSFHATAFSVLFEKSFFMFGHSAYNARMSGLLEKLGLSGRLYDETHPPTPPGGEDGIDWSAARARLAAERERSLQFIRGCLENSGG